MDTLPILIHAQPSPPPQDDHEVPTVIIQQIGESGTNALWAAFVIYILATLLFGVMARRHEKQHRVFHLLLIFITFFSSMSYYAMAINNGYKFVNLGTFTRDGQIVEIHRQIFWVRYLDWSITTPAIFLCLCLLSGLPWLNIIVLLLVNIAIMFTVGFASFHPDRKSAATWGWFTFGCIFLVYVLVEVLYTGFKVASNRHTSLHKLYATLAIYISVLWVLFPLNWTFSQGAALTSVDFEIGVFAFLDVLSTVVFGLWLLLAYKPTRENEIAAKLPDWFVEERSYGAIQLPE